MIIVVRLWAAAPFFWLFACLETVTTIKVSILPHVSVKIQRTAVIRFFVPYKSPSFNDNSPLSTRSAIHFAVSTKTWRMYQFPLRVQRTKEIHTSSTFLPVLADASKKRIPFSCANCCASSVDTHRRDSRSHLFPTSATTTPSAASWRTSSNHPFMWMKLSLL